MSGQCAFGMISDHRVVESKHCRLHSKWIWVDWTCFWQHTRRVYILVSLIAPTWRSHWHQQNPIFSQNRCENTSGHLWQSDSCSPSLLPCLAMYIPFSKTLLYCSFSLHCLSPFTSGQFSFCFLLFLFGRFNAFTPPLHSCGCFIHQSTALFNQPHGIFVCSTPPPTPSPPSPP